MRNFKFLKQNTWYNSDQQVTSTAVGVGRINYINVFSGANHAVLETEDVMSRVINASQELRERVASLEREIIELRSSIDQSMN